jgi:aryl-alcohol dehydrogenase-like predicted oxidoreductase
MTDTAGPADRAILGLCGPVPRLVLGSVNLTDERPDAGFAVLDAFAARGGRLIDTALVYAGGHAERLIGLWLAARPGTARQMLVLTKGAHPDAEWHSRMTPEKIADDISASLGRLGAGAVAAWLVHRDDEAVPVGEIVDALDALVRTGQARSIGVSNWRLPRLREAVTFAAAHDRAPIVVSSSYLGLAEAIEFPWPGCQSARDDETLAWHAVSGLPLLAWSSQASGFFAPTFDPATANPDLVSSYVSEANLARRARAEELGAHRGWDAAQVALAWVLSEPSAPFAAFGVRDPAGIDRAWAALETPLTPGEGAWLDTGDGAATA